MGDIKSTVKDNLIRLRHKHKLTQLELAQKINYSDKAISRWETGEVTPDVETLAALAELYAVPVTSFFLAPDAQISKKERRALEKAEKERAKQEKQSPKKDRDPARARRAAIFALSLCLTWTIVLSLFFALLPYYSGAWGVFVWGVPATALLFAFFFHATNHPTTRTVFASFFIWSALAATYLQIAKWSLFPILFIGIPFEAILLLYPYLKRKK